MAVFNPIGYIRSPIIPPEKADFEAIAGLDPIQYYSMLDSLPPIFNIIDSRFSPFRVDRI
jgi:hypothetical protein